MKLNNSYYTFYEKEDIWNAIESHKDFKTFKAVILSNLKYTGDYHNAGEISVDYIGIAFDNKQIKVSAKYKIDFSLNIFFKKGSDKGFIYIQNQLKPLRETNYIDVNGQEVDLNLDNDNVIYITVKDGEDLNNVLNVLLANKSEKLDINSKMLNTFKEEILKVKLSDEKRFKNIQQRSGILSSKLPKNIFKIEAVVEGIPIFKVNLEKNSVVGYVSYFGFRTLTKDSKGTVRLNIHSQYNVNDTDVSASAKNMATRFYTITDKLTKYTDNQKEVVYHILRTILDSRVSLDKTLKSLEELDKK